MNEADAAQDARGQAGRGQRATVERGHEPDADGGTGRAVPTHASFFSGVGGLDLGLERAGWRTVSFSEIDPYASAVLRRHWPDVPNLGDIGALAASGSAMGWTAAILWTGGFPCQDLSVAGKRRGMGEGTRSGLAYAFLDLVERHRPPLILLENVPGLLSSHGGRDMAALLGAMVELGYGVAYRIIDARYSGVPQRRRRVFIVGVRVRDDDPDGRAAAYGAASILAVGTRGCGHTAKGDEAGAGAAGATGERATFAVRTGHQGANGHGWAEGHTHTIASDASSQAILDRPPPDADGMRATDGVARRLDGGAGVAATLNSGGNSGGFRTEPGEHLVIGQSADADLDPLGLDSHRYRCAGNGVIAPVAEWIGVRLRRYLEAAA